MTVALNRNQLSTFPISYFVTGFITELELFWAHYGTVGAEMHLWQWKFCECQRCKNLTWCFSLLNIVNSSLVKRPEYGPNHYVCSRNRYHNLFGNCNGPRKFILGKAEAGAQAYQLLMCRQMWDRAGRKWWWSYCCHPGGTLCAWNIQNYASDIDSGMNSGNFSDSLVKIYMLFT